MALTPPFDLAVKPLLKIAGDVSDKLGNLQSKITDQLTQLQNKLGDLPTGTGCDDPRINQIKQQLERVNNSVTDMKNLFKTLQGIADTLLIIATITAVAITLSLIVPLGLPESARKALEVAAVVIATILGIITFFRVIIGIASKFLPSISGALGPIINQLGSICNNETFVVDTATANSILDDISRETAGYENMSQVEFYDDLIQSEFYRDVNVSESDLQDRTQKIEQLLEQQRSLLENLIEAPSTVYKQSSAPSDDLGKSGDYYINTQTKLIYGPKINDTNWGDPVN